MPRTTRMARWFASAGSRTRHTSKDIMARKIRDTRLESRTARLRLPMRKKPYTGPSLARGITSYSDATKATAVGGQGRYGHGGYWTKGFAAG